MKGILGRKIGMTQVFTEEGKLIPVTVVEVEPNVVSQIKTVEKDGYDAIQLATGTSKEKHSNKLNTYGLHYLIVNELKYRVWVFGNYKLYVSVHYYQIFKYLLYDYILKR